MNINQHLVQELQGAFATLFNLNVSPGAIQIKPTRKEFEGSHTLVIFPLAKLLKNTPDVIAKQIGSYLKNRKLIKNYNVIRGFLNLTLENNIWIKQLNKITEKGGVLISKVKCPKNVVVEFSCPNTNKPLHLGHLRNNSLGDAISNILLSVGHTVHRVNLINNRGIHICKSMLAYKKWGNGETPESAQMKGDHLVGKYYVLFDQAYKTEVEELIRKGVPLESAKKDALLMQEVQTLLAKWEAHDAEVWSLWETMNQWVYDGLDATYIKTNISFDKTYYESDTYLLGKQIVQEGLKKNIFYKKDDGSVWVDLTDVGLDHKLVQRKDGTSVYITQDLGMADLRYRDFNFEEMIYIVGDEQNYHFKVLFEILKKLHRNYADKMLHMAYGMVELPDGKMKSREGTVVDADDLVDTMTDTAQKQTENLGKASQLSEEELTQLYETLALGALKYFLVRVEAKKKMIFDPTASVDFQGDTGTFIQYTYVRILSILRKANQLEISLKATLSEDSNLSEWERNLIFLLTAFSERLLEAAETLSPSIIAHYILELAKHYNKFYASLNILNEPDLNSRNQRLIISKCVAETLKKGMELLGIKMPKRM